MKTIGEMWWLLLVSVFCVGAAMIPLSFLYVFVKGSWLVLKYVWLASW